MKDLDLQMKIATLLEQTTKARVYASIVSLSSVYSDKKNSPDVIKKAQVLHTRLLNIIRHPLISRVSLQDLLDEIEVDYPVPLDMDISWILEDKCGLTEFLDRRMVKRLSPTRFQSV